MNYLPTCTSGLAVQHPCQVSFKSMQACRRSWEDELKCVKILSVKDHNSAKICWTWIISPHALLDLWCNIPAKFHSNPCKDVGGVEKTNFDGMEGRTKQILNPPLPFYGGGIKMRLQILHTYATSEVLSNDTKINDIFTFTMNFSLKQLFWTVVIQGISVSQSILFKLTNHHTFIYCRHIFYAPTLSAFCHSVLQDLVSAHFLCHTRRFSNEIRNMRLRRLSSNLGLVKLSSAELCPLDLKKFQ